MNIRALKMDHLRGVWLSAAALIGLNCKLAKMCLTILLALNVLILYLSTFSIYLRIDTSYALVFQI